MLCIYSEFHPCPLVTVVVHKLTVLHLLYDSLFNALLTILNVLESTVCLIYIILYIIF